MSKVEPLKNIPATPDLADVEPVAVASKVKPIRPTKSIEADAEAPQPIRAKPVRPTPVRPMARSPRESNTELPDLSGLTATLPKHRKPKRSRSLWASFLLLVALPTLAATVYYVAIASNQYMSEFRFTVRSQDFAPAGSSSSATTLSGVVSGSMFTNDFMVIDYLQSRQAIEDLMKAVDLRKMYDNEHIDYLSRLRAESTNEELLRYWQSKIDASYDLVTGLALVRVRAFNPEDAHTIASALVKQSEKLVNDITARARLDAVKFAEGDVTRAEERLRAARADMRQFRDRQQTPDAARTAGGTLDLAMNLRAEVATLQSQLTTLRTYMDANAPSVKVLESRIAAVNKQIASVGRELGTGADGATASGSSTAASAKSAGGDPQVMAETLSKYEDVELSTQFAQKYYDTTLSALELARSQAATQQTYVATYVQPGIAQMSEYPQRAIAILIVFLACAAFWFVSVMLFFSIRDHTA
ncbi:hypothetical protein MWN34_08710 [Ancylobacter sp. 6x-1]|uniref:Capsule biosynthesis protein n=1 Tax=Ancylobacter crimeensis TaxID=2579147 RepID=A0ABT0DAL7_9HYPH|nr:hypothetical protein [Ancylobacter crimeensis]MCK0196994.1 hypothetical protein [Ancylobacter crimeensis]